jgi:hypothetical protein
MEQGDDARPLRRHVISPVLDVSRTGLHQTPWPPEGAVLPILYGSNRCAGRFRRIPQWAIARCGAMAGSNPRDGESQSDVSLLKWRGSPLKKNQSGSKCFRRSRARQMFENGRRCDVRLALSSSRRLQRAPQGLGMKASYDTMIGGEATRTAFGMASMLPLLSCEKLQSTSVSPSRANLQGTTHLCAEPKLIL